MDKRVNKESAAKNAKMEMNKLPTTEWSCQWLMLDIGSCA